MLILQENLKKRIPEFLAIGGIAILAVAGLAMAFIIRRSRKK